jgi:hypothetical protein
VRARRAAISLRSKDCSGQGFVRPVNGRLRVPSDAMCVWFSCLSRTTPTKSVLRNALSRLLRRLELTSAMTIRPNAAGAGPSAVAVVENLVGLASCLLPSLVSPITLD